MEDRETQGSFGGSVQPTPQSPAPVQPTPPVGPAPAQPTPPVDAAWPPPVAGAPSGQPARIKVHHSYIWLGSLRTLFAVIIALVFSMGSAVIGFITEEGAGLEGGIAAGILVAMALGFVVFIGLIVLGIHGLAYKHLWYELGNEEFSLYSGVISKKRVHVPYRRIQSVDQKASLLQRIFGVCNVIIDTAGGANNKAVMVPYVTKQQAEILRRELFARKSLALGEAAPQAAAVGGNLLDVAAEAWQEAGGIFAGQTVDTGAASYSYGLTNKELVLTGLSGNTAFVVIVISVLGIISQLAEGLSFVMPGSDDMLDGILNEALAGRVAGEIIALAVGAVLAVAIIAWLLSIVGACVSYGGFKASRRGNRIEVERGLLQHQIQGVNIDRVQSVVIKQSFIRRIAGYCEVTLGKIDSTEAEETSGASLAGSGLVVHPFVKLSRVPEILNGLIPEYSDVPVELVPVAPVACRRAIIRRAIIQGGGFWLAVTALIIWLIVKAPAVVAWAMADDPEFWAVAASIIEAIVFGCWILAAVLFVIDIVGAVLWARESSYAVNRRFMTVSNGGLTRDTMLFPRQKIQFGYLRANPLQRRAGTVTLVARTAAGVGGTSVSLIDVPRHDGSLWLDWVKPRCAGIERQA